MTRTVATRILPEELAVGDEICFDYAHPGKHPPTRVGFVVEFVGSEANKNRCVKLWDYSLYDGPAYQSYRMDKLRILSRIEDTNADTSTENPLTLYEKAISFFARRFLG